MDWTWGLPLALLVLACPLMMVGMMAFGWLFMRGHSESHSGHSMMMCHGGHGADGHEGHEHGPTAAESPDLLAELKAERERLDQLIARAEENKGD